MSIVKRFDNLDLKRVLSILLYGNDDNVILFHLLEIIRFYRQNDYQIIDIDCKIDKNHIENIAINANSMDFFESQKIIICSNIKDKSYTEIRQKIKFSPECKIIFVFPDAQKTSLCRKFHEDKSDSHIAKACYPMEKVDCIQMMQQILNKENISVENNDIFEQLYTFIGNNPLEIRNEIEKISILCNKTKLLTIDNIGSIIKIDEDAIFTLIDNFFMKNSQHTSKDLENITNNDNNMIAICRNLYNYAAKLITAKVNIQNGSTKESEAKKLFIFFKKINIFYQHLNLWSIKELENLVIKLLHIDKNARTGSFYIYDIMSIITKYPL